MLRCWRSEEFILARSADFLLWRIEIMLRIPFMGGVLPGLTGAVFTISSGFFSSGVFICMSCFRVAISTLYEDVPLETGYTLVIGCDCLLIAISFTAISRLISFSASRTLLLGIARELPATELCDLLCLSEVIGGISEVMGGILTSGDFRNSDLVRF